MRSNFNYYLQSREINEDYNNIVDLIISDKIKSTIRWDTLERVRQQEGVITWLKPRKLSLLADTHEVDKPNYMSKTSGNNNNDKSKNNNHNSDKAAFATPALRKSSSYKDGMNRVGNKNKKEERICNETNHAYQFCLLTLIIRKLVMLSTSLVNTWRVSTLLMSFVNYRLVMLL